MNYNTIENSSKITRKIIFNYVKEGHTVLDCTVGNGNDTLLLANLVGTSGKVYGFDIQKIALDITLEKLAFEHMDNRVVLIVDGHENIDTYITEKLDFIIYNLGYLPKGNKDIKTNEKSTLISLEKALGLLKENALLLITCYDGHPGGKEERYKVEEFLRDLNQNEFNVLKYDFINQINSPPILFGVEKSRIRRS